MLDVEIDGQEIKYLSEEQYFDEVGEEDSDDGGDEFCEVKKAFLCFGQAENSSLHY